MQQEIERTGARLKFGLFSDIVWDRAVTTGPNTGFEVSVPGRPDIFPNTGNLNPAWQERQPQCGAARGRFAHALLPQPTLAPTLLRFASVRSQRAVHGR